MQTDKKLEAILTTINREFDKPKIRVGEFREIKFNTQKLNGYELAALADLTYAHEVSVEVKRSGTGLVVILSY